MILVESMKTIKLLGIVLFSIGLAILVSGAIIPYVISISIVSLVLMAVGYLIIYISKKSETKQTPSQNTPPPP